ncbi:UDP-glycosyltransferase 91C1-like protein [Cinnamomum micranthum f. kanehirae]|uniref:UDP-glycosyltransferase 91C1-like protein n=1 Tax=Cinnamomum micranthum f. kanehirae TaxID=337451 RepID=A0A3S3PZB9_9MAGN|nr:UDP-glycosyltransferase 91C1-like protein [Cinnamomum micranthum f. kanehirae]
MGKGQGQHLVMVPWLAFGHLIPFFHLSVALAKEGFKISFLSTPKNIQRLPKPPQDLTALITFVELPLPHVDGLQEGAEATVDLDIPNHDYLKMAFDLLRDPFRRFITVNSPDWIIHDMLNNWTAEIAQELGLPFIFFSVYSAATLGFLGILEPEDGPTAKWPDSPRALMRPPPWIRFPSKLARLPHEANNSYRALYLPNESGLSNIQRFRRAIQGCQAIAIRTCPEYERDYLEVFNEYPKPVIPVGLLPPEKREAAVEGEWVEIFQWLDGKAARSVVFVGFGSECTLSRNEIYEIAHGLELSNLDFLWALRKPKWAVDDGSDALPPGFVSRTAGRGVVNMGWAPQNEILAHPAIGGSLFHSGWGSIIEIVQYGHALVVLPFINDQGLNARVAVEKGLAFEVERDEDGTFHRDAIANALKRVMVEDEGEQLRNKSREMMAIFRDHQLHQQYLNGLVDFLRNYKTNELQKEKCACK